MTVVRTDIHSGKISRHALTDDLLRELAKYVCGVPGTIRSLLERGDTFVSNYATWRLENP